MDPRYLEAHFFGQSGGGCGCAASPSKIGSATERSPTTSRRPSSRPVCGTACPTRRRSGVSSWRGGSSSAPTVTRRRPGRSTTRRPEAKLAIRGKTYPVTVTPVTDRRLAEALDDRYARKCDMLEVFGEDPPKWWYYQARSDPRWQSLHEGPSASRFPWLHGVANAAQHVRAVQAAATLRLPARDHLSLLPVDLYIRIIYLYARSI